MGIPTEYRGREQTYLKHRVLAEYLGAWGHKLGSIARSRPVRLWYVDCFAGPWNACDADLGDTSICIGLHALQEAAATWREHGYRIDVGAIFVEPGDAAYAQLERHLADHAGDVHTRAYHGEFGSFVSAIAEQVGSDPVFIFVDPTGWKGAAMQYIAPLVAPRREVLVNVMFNHVNRFKDDPRTFLRDQMREFFGLEDRDLPPNLGEEELLALYRARLKQRCRIRYAADLAVPHPTHDRTWYRLVVGGGHPQVLRLFRDVERKVVGEEASAIRAEAAREQRQQSTHQLEFALAPSTDPRYEELRRRSLGDLEADILGAVGTTPRRFGDLWPDILEHRHVTHSDVAAKAWELFKARRLRVEGLKGRERSVKDEHLLRSP